MSLLMDALNKAEEDKKRSQALADRAAVSEGSDRLHGENDVPGFEQRVEEGTPRPTLDRSEEPTIEAGQQEPSLELTLEPLPPERRVAIERPKFDRDGKSNTSILSATVPSVARKPAEPASGMSGLDRKVTGSNHNDSVELNDVEVNVLNPAEAVSQPNQAEFEIGNFTTRVTANTVFEAGREAEGASLWRLGGLTLASVLAALVAIGLYFEFSLPGPSTLSLRPVTQPGLQDKPQPTLLAAIPATPPLPTTPAVIPASAPVPTLATNLAVTPLPMVTPPLQTAAQTQESNLRATSENRRSVPDSGTENIAVPKRQALYTPDRPLIEVVRGRGRATVNALVEEAYSAFRIGELQRAEKLYREALTTAPGNRDALLGLGAIHTQRGARDYAYEYYRQALDLDPKDPVATAALFTLSGGASQEVTEERLKALLEHNTKTPELQFSLGNLYAKRARWADAQQAYFDAYSADSGNGDYAFNLAVSLERLGQHPAALTYYEKAIALAKVRRVSFSVAQATGRLNALQKIVGG